MKYLKIYEKYYQDIPLNVFEELISVDPSAKIKKGKIKKPGLYFQWLCDLWRSYTDKDAFYEELIEDIMPLLELYHALGGEKENKPLDSYIQIEDLKKDLHKKVEWKEDAGILAIINKGYLKVDAPNDWRILIPLTKEVANKYGKNTRWCTAGRSFNLFNMYARRGPLWIVINKKLEEKSRKNSEYDINYKWQYHKKSRQLMDQKDLRVHLSEEPKLSYVFENFIFPIEEKTEEKYFKYRNRIENQGIISDNTVEYLAEQGYELQQLPDYYNTVERLKIGSDKTHYNDTMPADLSLAGVNMPRLKSVQLYLWSNIRTIDLSGINAPELEEVIIKGQISTAKVIGDLRHLKKLQSIHIDIMGNFDEKELQLPSSKKLKRYWKNIAPNSDMGVGSNYN